jgi:hypothetical protein
MAGIRYTGQKLDLMDNICFIFIYISARFHSTVPGKARAAQSRNPGDAVFGRNWVLGCMVGGP